MLITLLNLVIKCHVMVSIRVVLLTTVCHRSGIHPTTTTQLLLKFQVLVIAIIYSRLIVLDYMLVLPKEYVKIGSSHYGLIVTHAVLRHLWLTGCASDIL